MISRKNTNLTINLTDLIVIVFALIIGSIYSVVIRIVVFSMIFIISIAKFYLMRR